MTDIEQAIAGFLDTSLSTEDSNELAKRIEHEPEAAREFLGFYAIDRLLEAKFTPSNASAAAQAVLRQLHGEQAPFVRSVLRNVQELEAQAIPLRKCLRAWVETRLGRSPWTLASVALLLLATIGGVWLWLGFSEAEPEVATVSGAQVVASDGASHLLKPGDKLRSGQVIETTNAGRLTISYRNERTQIVLGPTTQLKVLNRGDGKRFELREGKIEASIAPQRLFRPMLINTPQAEVRVLGTRFTLEASTNGTQLEVTDGKVRLARASDGKAVQVGAGNYSVVAANVELAALPQTGRILHEYCTNFSGNFNQTISRNPKLSAHPDVVDYLDRFETTSSLNNFSERIRGYVHPPRTGDYTFWIAGNGSSQFFLSRDNEAQNKVQIAVADSTNPHEWTKDDRRQQSSAITLVAGRRYYVEAVQSSRTGEHHLAVAWQGPGREREVISGKFLSPFPGKERNAAR